MTPHDPARAESAKALAERLGHEFRDCELLSLALTHRSWCAEHAGYESNERLEFLGDAVLGAVVTDHVYRTYPGMPEGELAKLRASVVSAATLAEVARRLDLGSSLRLGKGEASSGGRDKSSILADALEAVFGAIYVDGGFEALAPIVLGALADHIVEASDGPGNRDFKTKLQELAARRYEELPAYDVRDEGPDHEKRFFATVRLGGAVKGEGEGTSKKLAEQDAARAAWTALTAELALDPTAPAATSVHDASTEGEPPAVDDVALGDTAPGDINGDTTAAAPTADEDLERKRASADA